MKINTLAPTLILALAVTAFSPNAVADYTIRCESTNHNYNTCPISTSGYVRVERQLSKHNKNKCIRGRNWDFNKREIWVDGNCKAEFLVEERYNYNNKRHKSSSSDAGKAVAAIAGIAILGAILGSQDKDHKDYNNYTTKYESDNYYGSRHTSYVPGWATGEFRGYNNEYSADVRMTINSDGRMNGNTGGGNIHGYFNDGQLHVGNISFDVTRTPQGFETRQHGDYRNTVRYHRVR